MALTEGDKALVEQTAFRVSVIIENRLKESFAEQVRIHTAECPVKAQVEAAMNKARGAKILFLLLVSLCGGAAGLLAALVNAALKVPK